MQVFSRTEDEKAPRSFTIRIEGHTVPVSNIRLGIINPVEAAAVAHGAAAVAATMAAVAAAIATPGAAEAPAAPTAVAPTGTASGAGDVHAEVVVLGSGPGGYTAAFRAADLGKKVTLV